MKRSIMKKIVLVVVSLVLFSCNEDVLNTKPSDQIPNEEAVANVRNARATLFGAYSRLLDDLYYTGTLTGLGDIMTGNASITAVNTGRFAFMYRYDYNSTTQDVNDIWIRCYSIIGSVNPIIAAMPEYDNIEDPDIEEKDQVLGEAYAIRALAFFDLMRVYGDRFTSNSEFGVPIPATLVNPDFTAELPRSSVNEVYEYILNDLNTALTLMDEDNSNTARFNTNAVNALLSRVYLYRADYENAIAAANRVSGYSLINNESDFRDFWLNSEGPELIFKIATTEVDDVGTPFGWIYNFGVNGNRQDYIPTAEFLSTYEVNDFRSDVYYADLASSGADGQVRTTVVKYPDNPAIGLAGVVEIMPLRYAEVILNRAEAYYENGQQAQALSDLNLLRGSRGLSTISLSGIALRDEIRAERRRELAFEGHYWHDLKRWNLDMVRIQDENCSGANCEFTVPASSNFWLFPVPVEEVNNNRNITQAPGYAG
ncbi:RagB/SusD family nutrient uptake outer membrane protein [Ascidiimonas aurantiaca]|uniref:RagB/SusD family nutrient uptake outer membrane protein n=1 Tax=Ascidiimonas aurantiaca TaxID=1685432 RepID=UPI0030ED72B9